ncbi:hypothetical protein KP509_02G099000 [Ceratopteris richardii]|uniref:Pollen Ole e 1 allergen and extensin family protein n=1 Tax=Ceratopteris richardii TaxID=49495 RepID=A0A8T2VH05_CERRI|nr:hypothetical protein KP509_02G099000 [Ceratopteris richardii]
MAYPRVAVLSALAILASLLAVAAAEGYYGNDGDSEYVGPVTPVKPYYKRTLSVQGVVLCQNCLYRGTPSLSDAKPLEGARVKLQCRDRRSKVFLYDTARTDENGYFLLSIPTFDFRNHDAMRTCRVFLLSSPSPTCNRRTNINTPRYGAFLRDEKIYPSQVLYSAGPFAFASRGKCVKPRTPEYTSSPAHRDSPAYEAFVPSPPIAYNTQPYYP